jgi:hypothetical protein
MPGRWGRGFRDDAARAFASVSSVLRRWRAPPLVHGFVTAGLEPAFADACARLQLTPLAPPFRSRLAKSCNGPVASADGERRWLKITGIPQGTVNQARTREQAFDALDGIPKPAVIGILDWEAAGVAWRARQSEIARSPVASSQHFGRELPAIGPEWISSLRVALGRLAAVETSHYCMTPDLVAGEIARLFGPDAPRRAEEWQVAHGDLNWTNLTAPEVMLLDGETWGLAPRGYDLAYLIVNTGYDDELMRRLELAFADELRRPSGRVAQLAACAVMLNYLTTERHDPVYQRRIEALAGRAISGCMAGVVALELFCFIVD